MPSDRRKCVNTAFAGGIDIFKVTSMSSMSNGSLSHELKAYPLYFFFDSMNQPYY